MEVQLFSIASMLSVDILQCCARHYSALMALLPCVDCMERSKDKTIRKMYLGEKTFHENSINNFPNLTQLQETQQCHSPVSKFKWVGKWWQSFLLYYNTTHTLISQPATFKRLILLLDSKVCRSKEFLTTMFSIIYGTLWWLHDIFVSVWSCYTGHTVWHTWLYMEGWTVVWCDQNQIFLCRWFTRFYCPWYSMHVSLAHRAPLQTHLQSCI